jgi:ribosome-associated heat shock protein Hsp15
MLESVRADKWLWAVRLCKTRGAAAEWCAAGKVKRAGHPLKAAATVRPGDVLELPFVDGPGVRTFEVKEVIGLRVGAPAAQACYEDLTKPAVYESLKLWLAAKRDVAKGRPTKKNRREIDKIHGFWDGCSVNQPPC